MPTFKTFEEIEAWQKARFLSRTIYSLTRVGTFATDYKLADQINRASGSVMDNIAEGFERDGTKEFIQFLSIAKGSVGELRSQIYRSFDRNHIDEGKFEILKQEAISVGNLISGLIKYLKTTEHKGNKFNRQ